MKQGQIPYRMGDVVKKVKKTSWFCKVGEIFIIDQVVMDGKSFNYSTNKSAWHDHESFELVRESDLESLKQLRKSMEEE